MRFLLFLLLTTSAFGAVDRRALDIKLLTGECDFSGYDFF